MRNSMLRVFATVLLSLLLNGIAHADAVTDCAKIQGKAFAVLFGNIFKEAARACGKGSAGNPLTVSQAAAASASGKFFSAVGKGVDKFGVASCVITLDNLDDPEINTTLDDILQVTRSLADQACQVTP